MLNSPLDPPKDILPVDPHIVKKRLYTKAPGTAYLLPSDDEERERLTKQHSLLTRTFGGLVLAPVTLSDEDWVLDSATGTGIWLLETAKVSPVGARFVGIDIEPRLFPNPATLPHNVQFQVESVLNLPSEWSNQFSFVHQRLLVIALRTAEWPQALKEIYRVLKPGGWLQLLENDDWAAGPVMKMMRSVMTRLAMSRGIDMWPNVIPILKKFLEDCGFVDVRITRRPTPTGDWAGQDGRDGRDNMISVYKGIKTPLLDAGGFSFFSEEDMYENLLQGVEHEMNSTPGAASWWVTICAQKPEQELSRI